MRITKTAGVDCTLQSSARNHVPEKPPGILAREEAQAELIAALGCRGHGRYGPSRAYFHPGVREWRWVLTTCPECEAGRAVVQERPVAAAPRQPAVLRRDVGSDFGPARRQRSGRFRLALAPEDARRLKVGSEVKYLGRPHRIENLATDGGSTVATIQRLE